MIDAIVGAIIEVPPQVETPSVPAVVDTRELIAEAATPPPGWADFAKCVEDRESHGQPGAVNSSGHAGLFQFSVEWRHGLPYLVQRGLVAHGMPAREARRIRLNLPTLIEKWPAQLQRVGFARVLVEGGRDAAMRHWHLAGSRCNGLAAS